MILGHFTDFPPLSHHATRCFESVENGISLFANLSGDVHVTEAIGNLLCGFPVALFQRVGLPAAVFPAGLFARIGLAAEVLPLLGLPVPCLERAPLDASLLVLAGFPLVVFDRPNLDFAEPFGEGLTLEPFLPVVVFFPLEAPEPLRPASFLPTTRARFKEDWFSMAVLIRAMSGKSLVVTRLTTSAGSPPLPARPQRWM